MTYEPRECQATLTSFVLCEPARLADTSAKPLIALELSMYKRLAIPLENAQDLVVTLLLSLTCHGDELARTILEEYFVCTENEETTGQLSTSGDSWIFNDELLELSSKDTAIC